MNNKSRTDCGGVPGEDRTLANGAVKVDVSDESAPLEHGFDALSKARLTDVVMRLRAIAFGDVGALLRDLESHNKSPVSKLDQRISFTLGLGLLNFLKLHTQFEILLLEGEQFGVVSEESVLRLEQLVVELRDDRRDLVKVADAERGLPEFLGGGNGANSGGNNGNIHEGSSKVKSDGVVTAGFTVGAYFKDDSSSEYAMKPTAFAASAVSTPLITRIEVFRSLEELQRREPALLSCRLPFGLPQTKIDALSDRLISALQEIPPVGGDLPRR